MTIQPLLDEARQLLTEHPRDDFHDWSHHQRVWENAQHIVQAEKLEVDLDVLSLAVCWHDVMMSPESLSLGDQKIVSQMLGHLRAQMKSQRLSSTFIAKVVDAIKPHGFLSKHQRTIESKILFDADKLDALNPVRYRRIISGIKNKKLSRLQVVLLANAARFWLSTMRKRYHFDTSRKIHDQLIKGLLSDQEAVTMANEWGVDIRKIVAHPKE